MEVEFKAMLDDLDVLEKSLSDPAPIHKVFGFLLLISFFHFNLVSCLVDGFFPILVCSSRNQDSNCRSLLCGVDSLHEEVKFSHALVFYELSLY